MHGCTRGCIVRRSDCVFGRSSAKERRNGGGGGGFPAAMSALEDAVTTTIENPTSTAEGAADGAHGEAGDADAKSIIQGFRERRDERAFRAALAVLALGMLITLFGVKFAAVAKHMDWSNPQLWAVGFGLTNVGLGLAFVVGDQLNFEREFGSVTPDRPQWLLVLVPYLYVYATLPAAMFEKYGWAMVHMYFVMHYWTLVCLVVGVAQGKLSPFSPSVTNAPLYKRRPTVCEWFAVGSFLTLASYVLVDLQCWQTHEWDDGTIGPAGALVCIACNLFLTAHWVWRWGLRAFEVVPPDGWPWQRQQLLGNLWMQYNMHLGVYSIIWAALGPENQELRGNNVDLYGNLGLTAVTDMTDQKKRYSNDVTTLEVGLGFLVIPALCFYGRARIFEWLVKPFAAKQRLHDGVFIAALLAGETSSSDVQEHADEEDGQDGLAHDLIAATAAVMRRLPVTNLTLAVLDSTPQNEYMTRGTMDPEAALALSESCGLGGCDFFVSHSWSDDARQKYAQLMAVTLLFYRRHKRHPTFWLDKVCVDQRDLARTLRCLPVLVQSCSKLLILCGESYVQRLWCVWELYVHFAMSGPKAAKRAVIADCRTGADTAGTAADALHTFDVKDAHCYSAEDEARLRSVIESESAATFNEAIREVAAALLGNPSAGVPLRQSIREAGIVTNAARSVKFSELDMNGDGRLDRQDLLVAYGWNLPAGASASERQNEELSKRCAQIDDLLETINTGEEFRVNGGRSIGQHEFDAWIGRAT